MNHGLSDNTIERIRGVLGQFDAVDSAVLFGSRAKGTFKPGSDIDLTVVGENLTARDLSQISDALDELMLPYQIDLSVFHLIDHKPLREHIERVGKVVFSRS